jgi:hypothetical protein
MFLPSCSESKNDNLALTGAHVVQEQPHRLARFFTHESRQVLGHVQDSSGDNSRGDEGLADDPTHPRTICHSCPSNLHAHRVSDAERSR